MPVFSLALYLIKDKQWSAAYPLLRSMAAPSGANAPWYALALAAGVPVELVRRVTGHATVETVLKHYFRPVLCEYFCELRLIPHINNDRNQ